MAGNSFGELYRITTFGESHGHANGVVIDGIEPGFPLDLEAVQAQMDRRRPGQSSITTERKERDQIQVMSGLFEGKTTGAPLTLMLINEQQISKDYDSIKDAFRPGHGDFGYQMKYGFRDYRGGGRSSGRETSARVAAGAVAMQLLAHRGVSITAHTIQIKDIHAGSYNPNVIELNPVRCADQEKALEMERVITEASRRGESVGGVVACTCTGIPPGLGDPVFQKLDALLAHGIISIGAVKAIAFGEGFSSPQFFGSEFNDPIRSFHEFDSNHAGGILSGISTGQDITFRAAVRPTPSIYTSQQTIDLEGNPRTMVIEGRHDPCIVPRIVPVIEAMTALVLIDRWYAQFGRRTCV